MHIINILTGVHLLSMIICLVFLVTMKYYDKYRHNRNKYFESDRQYTDCLIIGTVPIFNTVVCVIILIGTVLRLVRYMSKI